MSEHKPFLSVLPKLSAFDGYCILAALALGIVFVGCALSPSSYGVVLRTLKASDDGVLLGEPQSIRSDEWAVLTPLTQAAVRNGFHRYNATSFYYEDLRSLYPIPLADWGIVIRPLQLPYLFLPPAYAFSFYYFGLFALSVFGYSLLFRRLGARPEHGLLLALVLFFTGFVQYWYTMFAPVEAWFPWLLLILGSKMADWKKALLLWYVGACWAAGLFYPPMQHSLVIVMLLLCASVFRDRFRTFRSIAWSLAGLLAGALTAVFYLRDYIVANLHTVYPGMRTIAGGLDPRTWFSQFFPLLVNSQHNPMLVQNICELSVAGTYYVLPALFFMDYAKWRTSEGRRAVFAGLKLPLLGFGLISAWMLLPLPAWVGMPLGFNRVPPERMAFAAGFLLLLCTFLLVERSGLVPRWKRFIALAAVWVPVMVASRAATSFSVEHPIIGLVPDMVMFALLGCLVALRGRIAGHVQAALLSASLVVGALAFGTYNPLQSSQPIFEIEDTAIMKALQAEQDASPNGTLVVPGFFGSVLNGLGFRSFTHTLPVPPMEYWAQLFPDMGAEDRNELFNRYAHINLLSGGEPRLLNPDSIGIPVSAARDAKPLSQPTLHKTGPAR